MANPCRHCGVTPLIEVSGADWLCPNCDKWQDTIACPTCGAPARISLLPKTVVPKAHDPVAAEPEQIPDVAEEGSK